jgi:hypothetical protein
LSPIVRTPLPSILDPLKHGGEAGPHIDAPPNYRDGQG